jgi:hypothetical protein
MLAALIEVLLQIVLEVLLEVIGDMLQEAATPKLRLIVAKVEGSTFVSVTIYFFMGVVFGALSYPVFPDHVIQNETLRIFYVALSPIALGSALCITSWVVDGASRERPIFRWDKFTAGALFSIAYSLSRYGTTNWT